MLLLFFQIVILFHMGKNEARGFVNFVHDSYSDFPAVVTTRFRAKNIIYKRTIYIT